jgi:hypothetical protein
VARDAELLIVGRAVREDPARHRHGRHERRRVVAHQSAVSVTSAGCSILASAAACSTPSTRSTS